MIKPKKFKSYLSLTKPRITQMQLVTVTIGFFLGSMGVFYSAKILISLLLGTYLVSAGACTLNHVIEVDVDSRMDRTKNRPLPQKIMSRFNATVMGVGCIGSGLALHFYFINALTGGLSLLTVLLYIGAYTPLKKKTWLNTFVGAIPGALPILGGWAAATNSLHAEAWMLFMVLFTWQHPHFYALAILYKEDYKKGKLQMLPVVEPDLKRTYRQIMIYTVLMSISVFLPVITHMLGWIYTIGMIGMTGIFFKMAIQLRTQYGTPNERAAAKKLFLASVIFLPVWLLIIGIDYYVLTVISKI